jgi:predicted nuclease of predicted toxin-antitoxin system
MKLLLDMNLSPAWVPVLEAEGWLATHWYSIGPGDASDGQIMEWAKERGYCVLTHDLDFSAILAATRAQGPSVVQIRGQDLSLEALSSTLIAVLRRHARALSEGAILTVDLHNARVRSLPLG